MRWWQRLRAAVKRRVDRVRTGRRGGAPAVGTRGLGVVGSIAAVTDPTPTPPPDDAGEELEVDLRAFLPDGVTLGDPDEAPGDVPGLDAPAAEAPVAAESATADEPVADEPVAADPIDGEPAAEAADPVGAEGVDDLPEPEIPTWALDDPAPADDPVDEAEVEDADADAAPTAAGEVEVVAVEGIVMVDAPAHAPETSEPAMPATGAEAATRADDDAVADAGDVEDADEVEPDDAAETEGAVEGAARDADLDEVDDGPSLPAWALPDPPADEHDDEDDDPAATDGTVGDGSGADADGAAETAGESDAAAEADEAQGSDADAVDTSVLERIEAELAEVEDALAAIDAGDLTRSPLLVRLLADQD